MIGKGASVSSGDIIEQIKEAATKNRDFKIKVRGGSLTIPLKLKDKKALELIERLVEDPDYDSMSFGEAIEILQDAIVWLNLLSILTYPRQIGNKEVS